MTRLAACLLCALVLAARADPAPDSIKAQRIEADARLATQERECATRFIVAACVEAARADHRAVRARLRAQEIRIGEAQRRATALARRQAISEKAASQQAHASEAAPERPVRDEAGETPKRTSPAAPWSSPLGPPGSAKGSVDAARSQAQFEARQREAQSHREAVERRNAQRRVQGKAATPLPLPEQQVASAPR